MSEDDAYVNDPSDGNEEASSYKEKHPSLFGRIFTRKSKNPSSGMEEAEVVPKKEPEGVAHVPTAMLAVEYLDEGPAMDAELKELDKKLGKLETLLGSLQENTRNLIMSLNKQNRDLVQMIESLSRRLDILYKRSGVPGTASGVISASDAVSVETVVGPVTAPSSTGMLAPPKENPPVPEKYLDDAEHKRAQRIARVMASDLEAYNESKVREGILYGNFFELLAKQIEDARTTFEQRVPERVRDEYDYFTTAINELIVKKREELLGGAEKA